MGDSCAANQDVEDGWAALALMEMQESNASGRSQRDLLTASAPFTQSRGRGRKRGHTGSHQYRADLHDLEAELQAQADSQARQDREDRRSDKSLRMAHARSFRSQGSSQQSGTASAASASALVSGFKAA